MPRVVVLVVIAACGAGEDDRERAAPAPPPPTSPAAPATPPPPPAWSEYAFTAQWFEVKTTEGCFYFSGPDGRNDKLGPEVVVRRQEPDRIKLEFGNAVFTGTARDGELDVTRDSTHDFNGRWTVREQIRGKAREEREMRARYRYQECQDGVTCPGQCRIDAELVLRPR